MNKTTKIKKSKGGLRLAGGLTLLTALSLLGPTGCKQPIDNPEPEPEKSNQVEILVGEERVKVILEFPTDFAEGQKVIIVDKFSAAFGDIKKLSEAAKISAVLERGLKIIIKDEEMTFGAQVVDRRTLEYQTGWLLLDSATPEAVRFTLINFIENEMYEMAAANRQFVRQVLAQERCLTPTGLSKHRDCLDRWDGA